MLLQPVKISGLACSKQSLEGRMANEGVGGEGQVGEYICLEGQVATFAQAMEGEAFRGITAFRAPALFPGLLGSSCQNWK